MATSKTAAPNYTIESVDNALTTLRMLCDAKKLRLSEVSTRLDVAHSTAHRLLSMLVHHGFAKQDESRGEYVIGPTFVQMGFAAILNVDIKEHARPILEKLRDSVNETASLGLPYGREVLYVECAESRQQLRSGSRVGSFVQAHCVSLGKVLLATLSPEELRRTYPDQNLPTLTERTVGTFAELEQQLQKIRKTGFARSRAESSDGVGSIAVAIVDRHGVGRAAISISAPLTRITRESEERWIAAAQDAAANLRARLWGGPVKV
ncbi:MAG: IclR family transcriptional regulator [Silvibacterium sp.]|nr:IclR family transcriptional regulator [Silvibacterium sp.]